MLREGTWLVRHLCIRTTIYCTVGAQSVILSNRTRSRLSTVHRFSGVGFSPALSALAQQEETSDSSIDEIRDANDVYDFEFGHYPVPLLPARLTVATSKQFIPIAAACFKASTQEPLQNSTLHSRERRSAYTGCRTDAR
jgi:hypothetical protein